MGTRRILIADDDEGLRKALADFLSMQGFEVLVAGDGLAAWELVRRGSPSFSILDYHMPGLTGLEVLKRWAEDRGLRGRLPCVLISAEASSAERREAERIGVFRFLDKPLSPEELLQAIRDLLRAFPSGPEGSTENPLLPLDGGPSLPVPLDLLDSLRWLLGRYRSGPGER